MSSHEPLKEGPAAASTPARDRTPVAGRPGRTAGGVLEMQSTLGNRAVARLVANARVGHRALQRITVDDARATALARGVPAPWYDRVGMPALSTMAARAGQDLALYLQAMTEQQFMAAVQELGRGVGAEPASFGGLFAELMPGINVVDSQAYSGMKRVAGTNVFIHPNEVNGNVPSAGALAFIQRYQSGQLTWYRGIGISHFSWNALRLHGTLASEGTADTPTFTMGNPNPHRWLPGLDSRDVTEVFAMTIPQEAGGIRDAITRVEVPTGAVVRYTVPVGAAVAYLNAGEQVLRGPVTGAALTVEAVHVMGPGYSTRWTAPVAPAQLPPAAPFNAPAQAAAILNWEAHAAAWAAAH